MTSERRDAAAHDLTRFVPPTPFRPLTEAQERVARLLAWGKTYDDIAAELDIARGTVQYHVNAIAMLLPTDEFEARDRVLIWAYWTYRASNAA